LPFFGNFVVMTLAVFGLLAVMVFDVAVRVFMGGSYLS
jgi:hypothetical protein